MLKLQKGEFLATATALLLSAVAGLTAFLFHSLHWSPIPGFFAGLLIGISLLAAGWSFQTADRQWKSERLDELMRRG